MTFKCNWFMLIIFMSMVYSFTLIGANDELEIDFQACLDLMKGFCGAENASPLECVKYAFRYWLNSIEINWLQNYYVLLFESLNTETFMDPTEFCRKGADPKKTLMPFDYYDCMNQLSVYWSGEDFPVSDKYYAASIAYYRQVRQLNNGIVTEYFEEMVNNVKFKDNVVVPTPLEICRKEFKK